MLFSCVHHASVNGSWAAVGVPSETETILNSQKDSCHVCNLPKHQPETKRRYWIMHSKPCHIDSAPPGGGGLTAVFRPPNDSAADRPPDSPCRSPASWLMSVRLWKSEREVKDGWCSADANSHQENCPNYWRPCGSFALKCTQYPPFFF